MLITMAFPMFLLAAGVLGGSFFASKIAEDTARSNNDRLRAARNKEIEEENKRKKQQNEMARYLSSGSLGVQTRRNRPTENRSIDKYIMTSVAM